MHTSDGPFGSCHALRPKPRDVSRIEDVVRKLSMPGQILYNDFLKQKSPTCSYEESSFTGVHDLHSLFQKGRYFGLGPI